MSSSSYKIVLELIIRKKGKGSGELGSDLTIVRVVLYSMSYFAFLK